MSICSHNSLGDASRLAQSGPQRLRAPAQTDPTQPERKDMHPSPALKSRDAAKPTF
jgi:hypothetical protein